MRGSTLASMRICSTGSKAQKGKGLTMASSFNGTVAAALARDWWVILVRGVVAVLFGILALFLPSVTLFVLVLLFGVYAIVDGILSFARAFNAGRRGQSWVWPTVGGVVGIVAGILAFVWPGRTVLVLVYIIAAWALVSGIAEIVAAVGVRREISNEWLLILGGVTSVLFALLVFIRPGAGALAIVWLIGFYAIVLGVERIALAFRVRDWQEHPLTRGGMGTMPPAAA
jgi:uncharacterized membrane protein HdeD (DUF308 family)